VIRLRKQQHLVEEMQLSTGNDPEGAIVVDKETITEQNIWEHYSKVEAENYYLKRQLIKQRKENKRLKHVIKVWKSRAMEANKGKKPRYRNNGKAGK
jgi:hypothetical protein